MWDLSRDFFAWFFCGNSLLCPPRRHSASAALPGGGVVDARVRGVPQKVLAVLLEPVEVRAAWFVRLPRACHVDALVADRLGPRVLSAVVARCHRVSAVHSAACLVGGHGAAASERGGQQQEEAEGQQRRGGVRPRHLGMPG